MSRFINADNFMNYFIEHENTRFSATDIEYLIDHEPTIEAIPKADYEARLKADMVAILTEIQLEIDELPDEVVCNYSIEDCTSRTKVKDLIQEKINALRGNDNE